VSVLELHLRFGLSRSPRAAELHVQRTLWEVDDDRPRLREEHRAEVDLRTLAVTSEQRERLLAGWWSTSEEPDPRVGSREWRGLLGQLLVVAGAPPGWFEGLRSRDEHLRIVLDPVDRSVRQLALEQFAASIETADIRVADAADVTLFRRSPPPLGVQVAGSGRSGATPAAWPGRRLAVGLLAQGEFAEAEAEAARAALVSWETARPTLPAPTVRRCEVVQVQPAAVLAQLKAALRQGPELLVLWGHGNADGDGPGTWWTKGVKDPEGAIDAAHLSRALEFGRPEVLVLAMCDGAMPGRHGADQRSSPSLAEAAAAAGVPLVLAFRGKVNVTAVNRFLAALVEKIGAVEADRPQRAVGSGEPSREGLGLASLDLMAWEKILSGLGDDHPSPLVHVASHLLIGRGSGAPSPPWGVGAVTGSERPIEREIHEAVAQLVVVEVPGGPTFRVPLPRKRTTGLTLWSEDGLLRAEGCRRLEQLPVEVGEWAGSVDLIRTEPAGSEPVLTEAAELVALVDALAEWRHEPAPRAVVEAVAAQVDRDLGTWGSDPLAIEVGTGKVLRRFDGWPAYELELVRVHVPDAGGVPLPTVASDGSGRWLEAIGPGADTSMRELAAVQRAAFRDEAHPSVTDSVLDRLVGEPLPLVLAPRLWRVHL
jgi:hypothetical protein